MTILYNDYFQNVFMGLVELKKENGMKKIFSTILLPIVSKIFRSHSHKYFKTFLCSI